MKKIAYKVLLFLLFIFMLNIKYVYAEIGVESSLASEMTEEYKNNITVQEVSLTSNKIC